MSVHLGKAVPTFPVKDVPASIAYYRDVLGFALDWDDAVVGTPTVMYASVSRGDFQLSLNAHPGPPGPTGAWCYVSDARALFAELSGRGANLPKGLEEMSWGEIELEHVDPDGNSICFTQRAPRG